MEPESPNLLARIRWGNVAWALVAVLAIGVAVAWPRLRQGAPGVPDGSASTPRAAPPSGPSQLPIAPGPIARPPTAPRPPSHPRPARRRRPVGHPHAARPPRARPRRPPVAPSAPPLPPAGEHSRGGGPGIAPTDAAPAPPAGDQEFLPG